MYRHVEELCLPWVFLRTIEREAFINRDVLGQDDPRAYRLACWSKEASKDLSGLLPLLKPCALYRLPLVRVKGGETSRERILPSAASFLLLHCLTFALPRHRYRCQVSISPPLYFAIMCHSMRDRIASPEPQTSLHAKIHEQETAFRDCIAREGGVHCGSGTS